MSIKFSRRTIPHSIRIYMIFTISTALFKSFTLQCSSICCNDDGKITEYSIYIHYSCCRLCEVAKTERILSSSSENRSSARAYRLEIYMQVHSLTLSLFQESCSSLIISIILILEGRRRRHTVVSWRYTNNTINYKSLPKQQSSHRHNWVERMWSCSIGSGPLIILCVVCVMRLEMFLYVCIWAIR